MKILMRASQNPFDNFNAFDTLLTDKLWANIGNLLFPYSLYRNLFSENTSIETIAGIPHPDEAAEINDNYDMLLLPFANAFRPSFISQLNRWTALVKELKIQLARTVTNCEFINRNPHSWEYCRCACGNTEFHYCHGFSDAGTCPIS